MGPIIFVLPHLIRLEQILQVFLLYFSSDAQREVTKDVFEDVKENKEVLALAFSLASMVLTSESDQQWLDGEEEVRFCRPLLLQ